MAIEEPEKYGFLAFVDIDESDEEIRKDKVATVINSKKDNYKAGCNKENVALIAGAGSYDKDSTLLDIKYVSNSSKLIFTPTLRKSLNPYHKS